MKSGPVAAIIQARMGSRRLPGKSMAELAGKPLLWHVLERLKRSKEIDRFVLATTPRMEDNVLTELASSVGVETFRGSENDLIDRYYHAALGVQARIVVRICADNPVLEAEEVDRIIAYHRKDESDFSSNLYNILDNGYPDGLGAEVFDFETLEELRRITNDPRDREHVTTYFFNHPERYRLGTIPCPAAFRRPEIKLDVNTPEELAFIRAIYEYWYPRKPQFHITDILWWHDHVFQVSKQA